MISVSVTDVWVLSTPGSLGASTLSPIAVELSMAQGLKEIGKKPNVRPSQFSRFVVKFYGEERLEPRFFRFPDCLLTLIRPFVRHFPFFPPNFRLETLVFSRTSLRHSEWSFLSQNIVEELSNYSSSFSHFPSLSEEDKNLFFLQGSMYFPEISTLRQEARIAPNAGNMPKAPFLFSEKQLLHRFGPFSNLNYGVEIPSSPTCVRTI